MKGVPPPSRKHVAVFGIGSGSEPGRKVSCIACCKEAMDYQGNARHVPKVDLLSAGFSGPTSSNFDCRAGLGCAIELARRACCRLNYWHLESAWSFGHPLFAHRFSCKDLSALKNNDKDRVLELVVSLIRQSFQMSDSDVAALLRADRETASMSTVITLMGTLRYIFKNRPSPCRATM